MENVKSTRTIELPRNVGDFIFTVLNDGKIYEGLITRIRINDEGQNNVTICYNIKTAVGTAEVYEQDVYGSAEELAVMLVNRCVYL
jgi:hypothetical protein